MSRYLVLVAMMVVGGCALPVAEPPSSVPTATEESDTAAQPVPLAAASALLAQADTHQRQEQPARAVAAVERAIRIDPDHPEPWLALARLRLASGDVRQSENLARKARNLSPQGSPYFAAANALIARLQIMPR